MTQTLQVDGVEVLVEGEGPETLLLLHGWPDTRHLWDGTVAAVKDRFRCARFTWPGFEPGSPRLRMTLDENWPYAMIWFGGQDALPQKFQEVVRGWLLSSPSPRR